MHYHGRVTLLKWVAALSLTLSLTGSAADLQSTGPLAFGPNATLFVGDSTSAAVFAFDTGDRAPAPAARLDIPSLDAKVAALLSTSPDQIRIHDLKVNPISKSVYLSISRGRGPDAIPVILRVAPNGRITEVPTGRASSKVDLPGIPAAPRSRLRTNNRQLAITDLAFAQGQLIVAGLSNEEFSSHLRTIPYPFRASNPGAKVEIYHTSHLIYETDSPVRTFLPFTIANETYLLAGYTCTPLVKFRLRDLKPGAQIQGATIAELGRHNSPLDMIAYHKEGHDYLLVANTARGVLKLSADNLARYPAITAATYSDQQELPIQKVSGLRGVVQLEKLDDQSALILVAGTEGLHLRTIPLP